MRTEMIDTFDKYRQFASAIGGYYEELVQELIARTIAVEADALEQARLNGMGSEREAALMAKLEAAEKERDTLHTEFADLRSSMTFRTSLIGRIEAERDALRTKVEAMENQEPVAIAKWTAGGVAVHLVGDVRPGDILYLAPGAQPTPSVPEGASGEVFEHWNVVRSTQSAPNPSRMLIEDSIKEARISDIPFDFQMVSLEDLERFAAIISKHERDVCYEIAQSQLGNMNALMSNPPKSAAAWEIANRIQVRNNL